MNKPEDYLAKPNKTIKEHRDDLITELERIQKLGYIMDPKIYKLTKKACLYHDLGKANCEFQKRVMSERKIKMDLEKEVFHNILSIYFIDPDDFETKDDYYKVVQAVLFHHDYTDCYEALVSTKERSKLLLNDFHTFQLKNRLPYELKKRKEDQEVIKIKGFLHKCDYSASGNFVSEYPNDFLEEGLKKLEYKWNELQEFCIKNSDQNIIAVAQTGMGKTEAGLLWIGNHKGYFVLPLRTAINAIYKRIVDNGSMSIVTENIEERVALLHSSSLSYYLEVAENEKTNNQELNFDEIEEYHQRGLQHSMPLNISTLDQLFDFIFKYQGYELKLTTLSYSKLVIDEIQMYDGELLAFLIMGIKKIVELGGKIAILTATLAPFVADELKKAVPGIIEKSFNDDMLRHNMKIIETEICVETILNQFTKNKNAKTGNKILVIANTVKKAQEIFEEIIKSSIVNNNEVFLLHSKFTKKDRSAKEEAIRSFGKTYENDNKTIEIKNGIWISTSLVEASLDIDFDYIFTELQDLNSLLQRLGRCNRKGVKSVKYTNCFVYTVINENHFIIGDHGFIDYDIFMISKNALGHWNALISEKEKLELINENLTTLKVKNSDYYKKYIKQCQWIESIEPYSLKQKDIKLRNILNAVIIPSPIYVQYHDIIISLVEQINDYNIDHKKRLLLKEALYQYTLSVELYHIKNDERACVKNIAQSYPYIQLGKFEKIKVIECQYDEALGFRKMEYDSVRKPEIF